MLLSYQETDSKEVYVVPINLKFRDLERQDETIGGEEILNKFFSIPDDTSLIKHAWDVTYKTDNQEVAKEARILLSNVEDLLDKFWKLGMDLTFLPRLHANNAEDGSLLIEWIFSDYRIGFSIEPDLQESGWYLVSNKNLGEISASGFLFRKDIKGIVLWLLNFVYNFS